MASQPQSDTVMPQLSVDQSVRQQIIAPPVPKAPTALNRKRNVLFGLGIVEVLLGCITVSFGIAARLIKDKEMEENLTSTVETLYKKAYKILVTLGVIKSQGIWGGSLVIITGVLAISLKKWSSRKLYICNMIMAGITAKLSIAVIGMSCVATVAVWFSKPLLAMYGGITVCTLISFIVTLVNAVCSCYAICCGGGGGNQPVVPRYRTQPMRNTPQQRRNNQRRIHVNQPNPMQQGGRINTQPATTQMPHAGQKSNNMQSLPSTGQ